MEFYPNLPPLSLSLWKDFSRPSSRLILLAFLFCLSFNSKHHPSPFITWSHLHDRSIQSNLCLPQTIPHGLWCMCLFLLLWCIIPTIKTKSIRMKLSSFFLSFSRQQVSSITHEATGRWWRRMNNIKINVFTQNDRTSWKLPQLSQINWKASHTDSNMIGKVLVKFSWYYSSSSISMMMPPWLIYDVRSFSCFRIQ